ncbi:MAG: hypothetical protein R3195_00050 [Gemmatimonadota bacterium]|nr:hypothetical protein [Gemmatimonadota bacterium]
MSTSDSLPTRLFVGVVAIAATAHVAILLPTAVELYRAVPPGGRLTVLAISLSLVVAILACGLAGFLIVRAGQRYEARSLSLFLVLIAICWGSILRFASLDYTAGGEIDGISISAEGWVVVVAAFALALAAASLVRLSVRFPYDFERALDPANAATGRLRRWLRHRYLPWVLACTVPLIVQGVIPLALRIAGAVGVPPERVAAAMPVVLLATLTLIVAIVLGMVSVAAANFVAGYRRADEGSRRPALWLVVGIATAALMIVASLLIWVVDAVLPTSLGALSTYAMLIIVVAPLFMLVCVAVAILYSGAVDPRLALRKSTINGIAGTLGLLVFAGLENTLSGWVEERLGLPGALGAFMAGAAAAAVFLPARWVLNRRRDRTETAVST